MRTTKSKQDSVIMFSCNMLQCLWVCECIPASWEGLSEFAKAKRPDVSLISFPQCLPWSYSYFLLDEWSCDPVSPSVIWRWHPSAATDEHGLSYFLLGYIKELYKSWRPICFSQDGLIWKLLQVIKVYKEVLEEGRLKAVDDPITTPRYSQKLFGLLLFGPPDTSLTTAWCLLHVVRH